MLSEDKSSKHLHFKRAIKYWFWSYLKIPSSSDQSMATSIYLKAFEVLHGNRVWFINSALQIFSYLLITSWTSLSFFFDKVVLLLLLFLGWSSGSLNLFSNIESCRFTFKSLTITCKSLTSSPSVLLLLFDKKIK